MRCVAVGATFLFLTAFALGTTVTPIAATHLRVGMPRAAFSNLNEADAAAAYRALIISAARRRGYEVQPELHTFDTLAALEAAVLGGEIQVCLIGSWQLLETRISEMADVSFVPAANGHVVRKLVLLARRDRAIRRIADLREGTVLLLRDSHVNLAERWLDTLCLRAGFGLATSAIPRVEVVGRPNAALLPVFFGTSDACVVDEDSFATASELNPQLRSVMAVLAESPPLLDSVLCINQHGWDSPLHREDLVRSLTELHREPSGRQLLTMFRMTELKPYTPDLLENVAALHREYVALLPATTPTTPAR